MVFVKLCGWIFCSWRPTFNACGALLQNDQEVWGGRTMN